MFSIDGKLWGFLSKMADLILVNVFFLIFSIPVVTIYDSNDTYGECVTDFIIFLYALLDVYFDFLCDNRIFLNRIYKFLFV